MTLTGPEHNEVRLPIINQLKALGWDESQLQWKPEWRVPRTPHDAAKREGKHGFQYWPVDLVLFQNPEKPRNWENVLGIFEFKRPDLEEGISQLQIYLGLEPRARFGVWSNGKKSAVVYKLPTGEFKVTKYDDIWLPKPSDDFELPASKAITFRDLRTPTARDLRMSFDSILNIVVARDSVATRSEEQLDQICNLLLLKLESDTEAELSPDSPVNFQIVKDESTTAKKIRKHFERMVAHREEVFREETDPRLKFDDHTIQEIVYEWSGWNMLKVGAEAVSSAFQVFRRANLKAGEGQYFTPARVVSAAVKVMDVQPHERIIDPACGTGGFLIETFRQMNERFNDSSLIIKWANRQVFGVDKDSINVKLTRAMMMILGDGSSHIHIGDSLLENRWTADYPLLPEAMRDESFDVVLTNPPFGEKLKISARDCEVNKYSISKAAGRGKYSSVEIGLVFLERAYRLLAKGGRIGIILPETYFFSPSYSWLDDWLKQRFALRGVINVPMEAFQGFCRAKTNLYIMEKIRTIRQTEGK